MAEAESPELRFVLCRALAEARRRSGGLEEMPVSDLSLLIASAARLCGVDPAKLPILAGGLHTGTHVEERAKAVNKVMPRRDRKALPHAVDRLREAGELEPWVTAMRATCRRAALLMGGDLAAALGRAQPADPLAADLLGWGIGDDYSTLRTDLGL